VIWRVFVNDEFRRLWIEALVVFQGAIRSYVDAVYCVGNGVDYRGIGVRFPAGSGWFLHLQSLQTRSGSTQQPSRRILGALFFL
jgi:hypothetical protein